jgi:hypothetical protein
MKWSIGGMTGHVTATEDALRIVIFRDGTTTHFGPFTRNQIVSSTLVRTGSKGTMQITLVDETVFTFQCPVAIGHVLLPHLNHFTSSAQADEGENFDRTSEAF